MWTCGEWGESQLYACHFEHHGDGQLSKIKFMYRHRLPSSFIFIFTHSFILYLTRRDETIWVHTFKQRCQLSDGAFSQSRVLTSRVFQSRFQKRIVQTTATIAAGRSSSTTHCCCCCCCRRWWWWWYCVFINSFYLSVRLFKPPLAKNGEVFRRRYVLRRRKIKEETFCIRT